MATDNAIWQIRNRTYLRIYWCVSARTKIKVDQLACNVRFAGVSVLVFDNIITCIKLLYAKRYAIPARCDCEKANFDR
jgi:hypothetical protein